MQVTKKILEKSQIELNVVLTPEEFKPFIDKGAIEVGKHVNIEGFRPGKVPYEILKQKVGEMAILEESARIAIDKTIDEAIKNNIGDARLVGQPQVDIAKLAPGNNLEYKITMAVLPEVTLGAYKDLKIKEATVEVKDEDVNKVLESLREMRAIEVASDEPAKKGDKIIATIEIFLDKVPVEGGKSEKIPLIIGKDYIIPGLSEKLEGIKRDETREFTLPFPKDYYQKNLAGKAAEFKVKATDIFSRQLPELDENFAKTLQAKNIDEIKDSIKKNIETEKKQSVEQKSEIEMIHKIVDSTKFGDLPEILVQHEAEDMMAELERTITQQGANFADYLQSLKKTRDQLVLDILPDAIKRVKGALVVREISLKEKIEVTDQEVDDKINELLKQYQGYEKVAARIKEPGYREYMRNIMSNRKVAEKLREWNVVK